MNTSSQRIFFILVAVVVLAFIAPVRAEEFGHGFLDGAASGGLSGDFKRGSRFALTEPGVLNMMKAFMDGQGGPQTGYQNVSMVLYQDAGGVPGVKLWESTPTKIQAQSGAQWYEFDTNPVALPAGTYWFVIHSGGAADGSTPGIARDYWSPRDGNNWYGNADAFTDGAASPFGAGGAGTGELLVFGQYLPARLARFAGRATVAATPSGGLSSNFKRGSRFTMTEAGRVFELSAYVDGKGGGTGSQKLRYVLYRDSGGVPGAKIVESDEVTIKAGQSAGWISAHIVMNDLQPGNYWIMIQSGDTAGVARDYGDGAANWYGNADTYSDGASSPFGSGNTGTVTVSATAMYIPGNVQMGTLGNTSQSGAPSGGLSANFSRGGKYGAFTLPNNGVLTAFWAYLDGNGGASGTQQVRVVLYVDAQTRSIPVAKMYQSDPVTIPAGMSARWVPFRLKAPIAIESNPGYWLMLQSGDKGGVVRDYGDNIANWWGFADSFADGGVDSFDPYNDPNVKAGTVELALKLDFLVPGT